MVIILKLNIQAEQFRNTEQLKTPKNSMFSGVFERACPAGFEPTVFRVGV